MQPVLERLVKLYANEPVADLQFIRDIPLGRRTVSSLADGLRVQAEMHAAVKAECTGSEQTVPRGGVTMAGRR